MKEKFTQGEWKVYTDPDHPSIIGVSTDKGEYNKYSAPITLYNQTSEANANLIAAAPDMYDMLNDLLNSLNGSYPRFINEYESDIWIEQVDMLLAKARGENVN